MIELTGGPNDEARNDVDINECVGDLQCNVRIASGIRPPQGCYSGAFDNRSTSASSYETEDSILEHFISADGGAFGFIGNSRYGWYYVGSTNGSSQRYNREFWDAVIYEGILNIGKALADAKEDSIGVINVSGPNRWCYFTTNLLGDPHTPLHSQFLSPSNFSATNVTFSITDSDSSCYSMLSKMFSFGMSWEFTENYWLNFRSMNSGWNLDIQDWAVELVGKF